MKNDFLKKENNNVNLIKFILSIIVVFYHSHVLLTLEDKDFLTILTRNQRASGRIAVDCFFILSGFFIVQSFLHSNNIFNFLKLRFIRLYPSLIVCLAFCAFIIGPLTTDLNLTDYFSHHEFSNFLFNNSFNFFNLSRTLPGVFYSNSVTNDINVSLWTLPFELYFYVLTIILGVLKIINNKFFILFLWIISIFLFIFSPQNNLFRLFCFFIGGICMFNFKDKINFKNRIFFLLILIIFSISIFYGKLFYILTSILLPYFLFFLAFNKKVLKILDNFSDLSFGIYIYSFPIQQFLVFKFPNIKIFQHFILSIIITFILAFLSYNFIEKNFVKLKDT